MDSLDQFEVTDGLGGGEEVVEEGSRAGGTGGEMEAHAGAEEVGPVGWGRKGMGRRHGGKGSAMEVEEGVTGGEIGKPADGAPPIAAEVDCFFEMEASLVGVAAKAVYGDGIIGSGLMPWMGKDLVEGTGAAGEGVEPVEPKAIVGKADDEITADAEGFGDEFAGPGQFGKST